MRIFNRKAKFNYTLFERLEAGIVLIGSEAKVVRKGNVDLSNSFVKLIDNEAYLINANIPIDGKKDYNPTRLRKLLLHKSELVSLKSKIKAKRLTLIPLKMYTKGNLVKLEIALAKTKRKFEKKESIKKKDIERELQEALKSEARSSKL